MIVSNVERGSTNNDVSRARDQRMLPTVMFKGNNGDSVGATETGTFRRQTVGKATREKCLS